jgi:hypothetical protein
MMRANGASSVMWSLLVEINWPVTLKRLMANLKNLMGVGVAVKMGVGVVDVGVVDVGVVVGDGL